MRHHGSPVRLMDWTYSFFVALYFAIETAENECVLWAMDFDWFGNKARSCFEISIAELQTKDPRLKSGEFFERVFNHKPPFDLVYTLNPERLNERLILQQGLFVAPANVTKTLEENIIALQTIDIDATEHIQKILIATTGSVKAEILRHLFRMNITRATLFPGLDGFAGSLATHMANPDILLGRIR